MADIKGLGIGPASLIPQYRVAPAGPRNVEDASESRPPQTASRPETESPVRPRGVVDSRAPLAEPQPESNTSESRQQLGNQTRLALDEFLLQVFRDIGYPPSIAEAKVARLTGSSGFQTVAVASALDQRLELLGFESNSYSASVRLESVSVEVEEQSPVRVNVDDLSLRVEIRDDTGFLLLSQQINLQEETFSGFGSPRGLPGSPSSLADAQEDPSQVSSTDSDQAFATLAEIFGAENVRASDGSSDFEIRINELLASEQNQDPLTTDTAEATLDELVAGVGLNLDA